MRTSTIAFKIFVLAELVFSYFFMGCLSSSVLKRPADSVVEMATEARERGDLNTAVRLLTEEIERGLENGRRLGLLFAMRATALGELGENNKAFDDCTTALQLIPSGKVHDDVKRLMDSLRYEMAESFVSGGIPIKDGWNGLEWGATIEDFKAKFPKCTKEKDNWDTGEGKEVFCGIWVETRYWFNSKGEFFQVTIVPSKADRPRLSKAMIATLGWPVTDDTVWNHESVEISCKTKGVLVLLRNTKLDPNVPEKEVSFLPSVTNYKNNEINKDRRTIVGVINEINLDWGLVIIQINDKIPVQVHDNIISYDRNGKEFTMIVEKFVAGKAVAKLPREIIRKVNLKSEVFRIEY